MCSAWLSPAICEQGSRCDPHAQCGCYYYGRRLGCYLEEDVAGLCCAARGSSGFAILAGA